MVVGEYVERRDGAHVPLRRRLLAADSPLPDVPGRYGPVAAPERWSWDGEPARRLAEDGLSVTLLPEPLDDHDFLTLGKALGTAIPERDPATVPYTDHGVILNLRSAEGHTDDVSRQPFATNALTMHSEGSGRAVAEQPRYIVLMCVAPGEDTTAPRTVLTPMALVDERLSPDDRSLLSATRYRDSGDVPTIRRSTQGGTAFSFRDFDGAPLRWECSSPGAAPDDVNAALGRLLTAMYAPDGAFAVRWTRGLLVVIDNTRFFHARTAGSVVPSPRPRHLKRLRIR
jgi:alpha-ketoglutarate-dependent taurine dioxygenase